MIRMIAVSLVCIIALYTYCVLRKRLQRVWCHVYRAQFKSQVDIRGTLVKDPRTDQYYVK